MKTVNTMKTVKTMKTMKIPKSFSKFLAWVLTFALVLTLIPTVPFPAQAADHTWDSDIPPTVSDGDTITIASNADGTLNIPAGAAVTIKNTNPIDGYDKEITLDIPADAKVIWQAQYATGNSAVNVTGGGFMEITGGSIHAELSVSDGTTVFIDRRYATVTGERTVTDDTAVIIEYTFSDPYVKRAFAEGGTGNISVTPEDAIAAWTRSNNADGIVYVRGANVGFIPVMGVIINIITSPSTPAAVTNEQAVAAAQNAVTQAIASDLSATAATLTNVSTIPQTALQSMMNVAKNSSVDLVVHADSRENNIVAARITIDAPAAVNLSSTVNLSAATKSTNMFEKFFNNEVMLVSLEQQGSFGAELRMAVKVDISSLDTSSLKFYSYNRETNSFTRITPAARIESNGVLHYYGFSHGIAGPIILPDELNGDGGFSGFSAESFGTFSDDDDWYVHFYVDSGGEYIISNEDIDETGETHTVTFKYGYIPSPPDFERTVEAGGTLGADFPEDPVHTLYGWEFVRWIYNPGSGITTFDADTPVTENIIVQADWQPIFYDITYDLDGGTATGDNPSIYTVYGRLLDHGPITLSIPAKAGFVFKGWTGTGLAEPTMNVTIPVGSFGNRTYTATWSPDFVYDLTFLADQPDGAAAADGSGWQISMNNIIISVDSPVTLHGDSGGRSVILTNATDIILASGTNINSDSSTEPALRLVKAAAVYGDGYDDGVVISSTANTAIGADSDVTIYGTINGISGGSNYNGIYASGDITLSAYSTFGAIHGGVNGIFANGGNVMIAGNTGSISGGVTGAGIVSQGGGTVEISGRTGNISGGLNGIATGSFNLTTSGITGTITGNDLGINVLGDVTISGTAGLISGITGIYARNGIFNISSNSVVYVSGLEKYDGGMVPMLPTTDSQGILFIGDEGVVYGDVTLKDDLTVTADKTLTIPDGTSLTIPNGVTLMNKGTVANKGMVVNSGTIINHGMINGDIAGDGVFIGIIIDLDNIDGTGESGYTADTGLNVIHAAGSGPVTIKGDGTNGGDGWSIVLENAADIIIENGTTIFGSAQIAALILFNSATIHGEGDDITITGGDGNSGILAQSGGIIITGTIGDITAGSNGIYAYGGITVSGQVGSITGRGGHGGISTHGNVTITGTIGDIYATSQEAGSGIGIYATNITISGTVGDISAAQYGILANNNGDITITENGKTGNITAGVNGIDASGSIIIEGTMGVISGGNYGIVALDTFTISNSSVVYTSGLSPSTTVSNISQGILFTGSNGMVYGNVTFQDDLTITKPQTLTIPSGRMLTIPGGRTLTNHGTITGDGGIVNNGTMNCSSGNIASAVAGMNKANYTGTIGWPTGLTAWTGQSLADVDISGGAAPIGGFRWALPADMVGNAGNNPHEIRLVWDNDSNYNPVTNTVAVTVNKQQGAAVTAPALNSKTHNSITINAVPAPANGQSVEYAISTTNTAPADGWQDSILFSGLKADTEYYIFARSAENTNFHTGAASGGTAIRTSSTPVSDPTPEPAPPNPPNDDHSLDPTDPSAAGNNPRTGDVGNLILWLWLGGVSALMVVVLIGIKRRRRVYRFIKKS
ncbi:MAG: hypothetical protein FWG69_03980 [Oscillospiraceae bacterium]|nr:hypothetical protein [Oscillospiraceae bacterium]